MVRRAATSIPHFALYGENTPSHRLEAVHIEDIHARSARNGWLIKPHRHPHLYQLLFVHSGETEARLDTEHHHLRGSWLLTMPTGIVHGFRFHPDTQGVVLSIAVNMRGDDSESPIGRLLDGILSKALVLKLDRKLPLFKLLQQQLQALIDELATRQEEQALVLHALVKLLLVTLRRAIRAQLRAGDETKPGLQLTGHLRQLVENHYREHWSSTDYAKALHVSVSTLNRACRDNFGCTTKKLLQDRLHIEAKRRLIYTHETLDRIADSLGYKDTAYFARVFKEMEGSAPGEFRHAAHKLAGIRQ